MKRLLTPFLALGGLAAASAPADAYCIRNKTQFTLSVKLKDYSPLGGFQREIDPGNQACCDWFDRRCNPTGTREALVTLSIREPNRFEVPLADGGLADTPIPTFDAAGNPDPDGYYDKYGNYDAHRHKPYYMPIETFDMHGRPDPQGNFDKDGNYDENGHRDRRRLVKPKQPTSPVGYVAAKPLERFCARGKWPMALVPGAGTVEVTENVFEAGGLQCEARDHFLRPVSPPSQAIQFGVPIVEMPTPGSTTRTRQPSAAPSAQE